ncbi:hypothetical protein LI7559_02890 [Bacillus licheniformis LMG 7559]|nr:hypothetical protein LI7559_02890 [Bacillus licheniformis LMG 7559]
MKTNPDVSPYSLVSFRKQAFFLAAKIFDEWRSAFG